MTDRLKFGCRLFAGFAVVAALAFGTAAAGYAQSMALQNGDPNGALLGDGNGAGYAPSAGQQGQQGLELQNGDPSGALLGDRNGAAYAPSAQEQQTLPAAMRNSVAETGTPCGGDFGMMESLEVERHGVAEANPCDAPVCD